MDNITFKKYLEWLPLEVEDSKEQRAEFLNQYLNNITNDNSEMLDKTLCKGHKDELYW